MKVSIILYCVEFKYCVKLKTLMLLSVIYDACPRSSASGLWWDRTPFGELATATCPSGSMGKASRLCNGETSSWDVPDLFNCTSNRFLDLRKVVRIFTSVLKNFFEIFFIVTITIFF